ncbi:unnamed protein product [Rhizoctonia solani]|uniref:Protein kinase domain-containing protein n=1 Tax=Rhizoctonia solani TaxID=456999 RepID=A0A8H3BIV0_9AGAM|nr:unnamed protein product [Rhizoctonia solani]
MPLNPETRLEEESITNDAFSRVMTGDGVSIQPTRTPSPELDGVHVSEGESPKLDTPEESNPLKALPLDVATLGRALNDLALAKERGCISVVQSDGTHHEERILATSPSTQLHCHPVPLLVISPHLFDPDLSGPPSEIVESHSSKKKKGEKGKGKRRKKRKASTSHGMHGINATNKPVYKPHSSPLDVLSEHIQNAISTSIFSCIDPTMVPAKAADQIESPEEVATNDDEGRNKMEVADSEWIKLAQPATQDEITGAMSIEEILAHLTNHGCEDVTDKLKIKSSSEYPVSNGGFGDVYRVILYDGRQLAFKCIRLRVGADIDGQKYLERAAHELYVWSKCQHRNVMELIGVARFQNHTAGSQGTEKAYIPEP